MGPKPRDYPYRPPKKVRRGALCAALSMRAKEQSLIIVSEFGLPQGKTKQVHEVLTQRLRLGDALVVDAAENVSLHRSIRNLERFDVVAPEGLNVESVLRRGAIVLTSAAAKAVEAALLRARPRGEGTTP